MAFYVNEDRPTNRSTVHRNVCIMAQHRVKNPRDGRWYGPFTTAEEALEAADHTGLAFTRLCRICNPRSDLSVHSPLEEK